MAVTVHLACSGCDATANSLRLPNGSRRARVTEALQAIAPEGWVVFDPFTAVTYCPKCWAEITDG